MCVYGINRLLCSAMYNMGEYCVMYNTCFVLENIVLCTIWETSPQASSPKQAFHTILMRTLCQN